MPKKGITRSISISCFQLIFQNNGWFFSKICDLISSFALKPHFICLNSIFGFFKLEGRFWSRSIGDLRREPYWLIKSRTLAQRNWKKLTFWVKSVNFGQEGRLESTLN